MTNHRYYSLDLIRGFAILGIYLINISLFAYTEDELFSYYSSYSEIPNTLYDTWNLLLYSLISLFAEQKMMTLFSMLFGASIILLTDKLDVNNKETTSIYFRRNLWLSILGVLHLLIWYGDILFVYSISAIIIFPFRKLGCKKLLILAIPINIIATIFQSSTTPAYFDNSTMINGFKSIIIFSDLILESSVFILYILLSFSNMLIGMAFYKSGFILGSFDDQIYRKLAKYLIPMGIFLTLTGITISELQPYYISLITPSAVLQSTGYISLIILLERSNILKSFQNRVIDIGQTALTSYLFQTIISILIFYDEFIGLRSMNLDMTFQLLIIIVVWMTQLITIPIWVSKFRYGPFEWLWRTLYYLEIQKLKK
ncbi:MAG: DUF418 domain-containing protein [Candidatus Kariarchaeum pelagius]